MRWSTRIEGGRGVLIGGRGVRKAGTSKKLNEPVVVSKHVLFEFAAYALPLLALVDVETATARQNRYSHGTD